MANLDTFTLKDAEKLFGQLKENGTLKGTGPVEQVRRDAIERFAQLGLPTQEQEEWRFTPVTGLAAAEFTVPDVVSAADAADAINAADAAGLLKLFPSALVFLDGHYRADLSNLAELPKGVTVSTFAENPNDPTVERFLGKVAVDHTHPFMALNSALFPDGLYFHVEANVVVETPIHILFLTADNGKATMTNPRLLVVAEANSQLKLVETYAGPENMSYFTNTVAEFDLEENAVIDHYRMNLEGRQAFHVATIDARQDRASNFSTQTVTFGGLLNRNDVGISLQGEGGYGTMNGLFQITGNQLVDNHTRIDHAQPNCETHELYKGILDEKSRGVFNGRIMVRQIAQKTDSKQTNRTLLLSSDALINTNPQLEIFADDVKCTHGATIGQIDEDQLYYLRSRGISEEEARRILIFAFANDVIERFNIPILREYLEKRLLVVSQETGQTVANV